MSRLQKKCFIAASGFHLLLILILMVGPAFLTAHSKKPEEKDFKILDVIPGKLIDEAFSGGGTPNATPPPPAPPAPAPVPKQTILEKLFTPDPPKPEKPEKPAPEKPAPEKPEVDPLALNKVVKPAPAKSTPKVNLVKVTRTAKNTSTSGKPVKNSDPEAEARAQQLAANRARAAAIGKLLSSLNSSLSSGVDVDIPGPGGAAYANYADALASAYYHAWILPDEASDDNASVKVKVTLTRDGSIVSARVVRPSGNAPLDRSVERVLNRIQSFQPFPEGSKDSTRTFNFEFQPKFRKLIG